LAVSRQIRQKVQPFKQNLREAVDGGMWALFRKQTLRKNNLNLKVIEHNLLLGCLRNAATI
jgi:hypothetical protein